MADMGGNGIQRPVSRVSPKWLSGRNEPESSEATAIGADSGDGNEPQLRDATTRLKPGLKWPPVIEMDTSIEDVISEEHSGCRGAQEPVAAFQDHLEGHIIPVLKPPTIFKVHMCCSKCEEKTREEAGEVPGVMGIKVDLKRSEVTVFGKVNEYQVLKKLKKVDKRAKVIFVVELKLQQASLDLIEAVKLGNEVTVSKALAEPGVDVNCHEDRSWHRLIPLLQAFQSGHRSLVRLLLGDHRVNVNAADILGQKALHTCWDECVKEMSLSERRDINWNASGLFLEEIKGRGYGLLVSFVNATDILNRSALHYIAEEGCVEILSQLLGKCPQGINVNGVDFHGFTPLHLAVREGHRGMVERLLQVPHINANVGALNASQGHCMTTIEGINHMGEKLDEARLQMRKLFHEEPTIDSNLSTTVRPKLFEPDHLDMCRPDLFPKTPTELSGSNRTPLHFAAMNGHTEIVHLLLKWKGIDFAAQDMEGFSPLDYSIQKGHLEVVKLLLNKGEPQTEFNYNDQIGIFEKLLNLAEKQEIAIHLLNTLRSRMKALSNTITNLSSDQNRLLASAATSNHFNIIRCIVKWQPEVNVNEASKWAANQGVVATPLHLATLEGHGKVVRELLKHPNLDVNTVDNKKMTALLYAIEAGNVDVVKALCEDKLHRLRANEENSDEKTPLQIVAEANDNPSMKAIKKVLLERPEVKDYVDSLYRDRQVFVDAANALLVGAALIASVTFAGWLQSPLGYTTYYEFSQPFPAPPGTYESYAAIKQSSYVKAFWVFNSLSFFFAIATVLAGVDAAMPSLKDDVFIGRVVKSVKRALIRASILLVISVVCVLGAFASAGFAVLPPLLKYDISMIITVCLGGAVCMYNLTKILWKLSLPIQIALLPTLRSVQHGDPVEDSSR